MQKIIEKPQTWLDETWKKLDTKLSKTAVKSYNKLPYTTFGGEHDDKSKSDPCFWTNGFWPGLMWLMYVGTKNEIYKKTAENAEELLDAALWDYDGLHHDVGFMWNISSGVNYRLFGGHKSKVRAFLAANTLMSRYNLKGGYIRAWNEGREGYTIIDSMMNIPILYWASRETGDERYKHIAMSHADITMRDHIRADGSAVHMVIHNELTGEKIKTLGGQGYEDGSSWSRGQSWAIYGFILSYIHTKEQKYLDTAKRAAHYFISCVCDGYLPKCDFRAPEEPLIYDSAAGACAACGLIEIANHVPEYEKKIYLNAAVKMLKAMEKEFCNWGENEDSILQMGTERYPCVEGAKVHLPIIYGDYYFCEAIYKLKGFGILFW
jgi:unsaturated chondroitin disaccharide hydrolase